MNMINMIVHMGLNYRYTRPNEIKESTETIVGNKKYNDKIESRMRQKVNGRGTVPLDCIGSQEFL